MKTTWWLRIVGMFYLFLALGSVWVVFINPNIFGSIIPFAANELSLTIVHLIIAGTGFYFLRQETIIK